MNRKKPVGITVCSILAIILSLSYFLLFYGYAQKRSLLISHPPLLILKEIFWLLMALVYIISAIFLFLLKRWARLLIILITSFYIIDYMFPLYPFILSLVRTLIANKNPNNSIIWLMLLFNILVIVTLIGMIVYLVRPKVKEQFK